MERLRFCVPNKNGNNGAIRKYTNLKLRVNYLQLPKTSTTYGRKLFQLSFETH